MAREIGKLNALAVSRAKTRGYFADGGGLYLQVSPGGAKSWVFRFRDNGKLREMGLGPTHTLSLAEARDAALVCRKQRLGGIDPIEARKAQRAGARLEAAKAMTFRQCAEAYIKTHKAGWQNAKHAAQWTSTFSTYAYPVMGDLPVQGIDVALVMKVIEPIWNTKTETASRLRGRIESVLDWAMVRGYRAGDNPARWRGHIDHLLPDRSKVAKVAHHAALPLSELSEFMAVLRRQAGTAARALEFAILTAARTGEIIGARWSEFDLAANVWIVPAERMKAKREHRVPLSPRAVSIIEAMKPVSGQIALDGFVFPGAKAGKAMSNMAMLTLLKRMDRPDITTHGFRSTFRDWASERTNFPREVAEMALAHTVGDRVEAAYRRGDLFNKRRAMMDQWGMVCETPASKATVVPMQKDATA